MELQESEYFVAPLRCLWSEPREYEWELIDYDWAPLEIDWEGLQIEWLP